MSLFGILRRRRRLAEAYRTTWESPSGRLVLLDILARAGVFTRTVFQADAGRLHFDAGRRAVGHELLQAVRTDMVEIEQALADAAEREREELEVA